HRLNLLGFLDLSHWGADFADSGNLGMLDIVAALRWINANIARFGGDPDRVTVFGGSFAMFNTPERALRLAELVLAELGLARGQIAAL
ncbi:carboxylesterase family protein, partial [Acinetobacter baumannii]